VVSKSSGGRPPPYLRARKQAQKQERRDRVLGAARQLLEDGPVAAFTMDALAAAVGLSKGLLYVYFRTKEEVFLGLLEQEFAAWLDDVDARLQARGRKDAAAVARLTVASLQGRTCLLRLLVVLESTLEHNLALDRVVAFKRALLARLLRTAALLEAAWTMTPGTGLRLLLVIRALVGALFQVADASPVAAKAYANPDLAGFRLDFAGELTVSLTALLTGWRR
jgi:AcrR family transcriptional regulator